MRIHLSGAPETEHCRRAERTVRHPDDYGAGQRRLAGWYPSIRNNQQQSPMAEQGIRLSVRVRREQCAIICRVHAKSQWALIPYVPMFSQSDRETFAARAVRNCVGIRNPEAAFLQVFAVVEHRAADEKCALWIDNQPDI